uniref:Uncharacterized protein n=1 Tax=Anguilla anguilla TaxID=7936 RepID=A0A0E9WSH5_ANGAN
MIPKPIAAKKKNSYVTLHTEWDQTRLGFRLLSFQKQVEVFD